MIDGRDQHFLIVLKGRHFSARLWRLCYIDGYIHFGELVYELPADAAGRGIASRMIGNNGACIERLATFADAFHQSRTLGTTARSEGHILNIAASEHLTALGAKSSAYLKITVRCIGIAASIERILQQFTATVICVGTVLFGIHDNIYDRNRNIGAATYPIDQSIWYTRAV